MKSMCIPGVFSSMNACLGKSHSISTACSTQFPVFRVVLKVEGGKEIEWSLIYENIYRLTRENDK